MLITNLSLPHGCWFNTDDRATMDEEGFISIVDSADEPPNTTPKALHNKAEGRAAHPRLSMDRPPLNPARVLQRHA
jgi:hypothetical protein